MKRKRWIPVISVAAIIGILIITKPKWLFGRAREDRGEPEAEMPPEVKKQVMKQTRPDIKEGDEIYSIADNLYVRFEPTIESDPVKQVNKGDFIGHATGKILNTNWVEHRESYVSMVNFYVHINYIETRKTFKL